MSVSTPLAATCIPILIVMGLIVGALVLFRPYMVRNWIRDFLQWWNDLRESDKYK